MTSQSKATQTSWTHLRPIGPALAIVTVAFPLLFVLMFAARRSIVLGLALIVPLSVVAYLLTGAVILLELRGRVRGGYQPELLQDESQPLGESVALLQAELGWNGGRIRFDETTQRRVCVLEPPDDPSVVFAFVASLASDDAGRPTNPVTFAAVFRVGGELHSAVSFPQQVPSQTVTTLVHRNAAPLELLDLAGQRDRSPSDLVAGLSGDADTSCKTGLKYLLVWSRRQFRWTYVLPRFSL